MILEKWHPVTSDLGLIQAPLHVVVAALINWHTSIGIRYRQAVLKDGLENAFSALLPLSAAKQRRLFVETSSDWTMCFQNGIQGSDPFPAMSFLAVRLGVMAMRVCSTPPSAIWKSNIWEVYAPPELGGNAPLGYRRSINCANDGGRWVFDQSGEPFEFERIEVYKAKRKQDRFSRDILQGCLGHFGIRPFADDFILVDEAHPATLLEVNRPAGNFPEYTLDEVTSGLPWNSTTHRK